MVHTVTRPLRFVNDKSAVNSLTMRARSGDELIGSSAPHTSGHQPIHEHADVVNLFQPLHQFDDLANVRAL
jgi:hypothetical protein